MAENKDVMGETVQQRFLLSVLRYFLTWIGGMLVQKGLVKAELVSGFFASEAFTLMLSGSAFFLISIYYSYKNTIWEFVKTRIGILVPPDTPFEDVVKIASIVNDKHAVAKGEMEKLNMPELQKGNTA
jgi:hypothetical protein